MTHRCDTTGRLRVWQRSSTNFCPQRWISTCEFISINLLKTVTNIMQIPLCPLRRKLILMLKRFSSPVFTCWVVTAASVIRDNSPSRLGSTQQRRRDTFQDGLRDEAGRRIQTRRKHSGGSPDTPSSLIQSGFEIKGMRKNLKMWEMAHK